jgi:hypothetical protein
MAGLLTEAVVLPSRKKNTVAQKDDYKSQHSGGTVKEFNFFPYYSA